MNQWVSFEVDFSSQAGANHKKIVLFFNPGNEPEAGDTYYIDDLAWAEKTVTDIENFEAGATFLGNLSISRHWFMDHLR